MIVKILYFEVYQAEGNKSFQKCRNSDTQTVLFENVWFSEKWHDKKKEWKIWIILQLEK